MSKLKACVLGAFAGMCLGFGATTAIASEPYGGDRWSWRGFYLGVHGGYGWKDNDFAEVIQTAPTLLTIGGIQSEGGVFGGQAGYNWQSGSVVAGLEIDFSVSSIEGSSARVVRNFGGGLSITDTEGDDGKYLGTARARVGFTGGSWLLYATGGLAWERSDRIDTQVLIAPGVSQTVVTRDPRDWFGWVAGVGVEAKLTSNWIGRVEYLHYDFGEVETTTTVVVAPGAGSFSDGSGRSTTDVVRAAISYKFN